ncbi:hypothetical protein [Corynebacterium diphtheriae]|uniref:hypothetical protein n=1 Tax=Corynebacterium diphtheriae TaxID=1717 RepID=UPI001F539EE9|nr:hypothetical protein [Corynebacterium diphtheriae]
MNHVILRLRSSRALTWAPAAGLLRDMTNTTRTTPTGRTLTLVPTHSDILERREQGTAHTPLQLVDGVEAGDNLTAQDAPERGVGDTDVVTELGGTGHGAHPAVTDDSPLQVLYEDLETDHVGFHTSRVGPRPPAIEVPRGDSPFLGSHINHSGRPMLARQIKNAAHKVTDDELAIELTAIISAKYYAARSHIDNFNGKLAGRVATYLAWVNGTYTCADLGELKAAASDEAVIAHYLSQVCEERPIIRTRLYHPPGQTALSRATHNAPQAVHHPGTARPDSLGKGTENQLPNLDRARGHLPADGGGAIVQGRAASGGGEPRADQPVGPVRQRACL